LRFVGHVSTIFGIAVHDLESVHVEIFVQEERRK
jgi:hypothetical protein